MELESLEGDSKENIDELGVNALRNALPPGFQKILNCEYVEFKPSASLLDLAQQLVDSKYGTEAWNAKR